MSGTIQKTILSEQDISGIVKRLGEQIASDYRDKEILVVGLLIGGVVFMADLIRELSKRGIHCELDFIQISSYEDLAESNGDVRLKKPESGSLADRHVLLVDEIVDTGHSLEFVQNYIQSKQPASFKTCVLLNKPSRRKIDIHPDYVGTDIEDRFVVGYGLDYKGKYRELPYIAWIDI